MEKYRAWKNPEVLQDIVGKITRDFKEPQWQSYLGRQPWVSQKPTGLTRNFLAFTKGIPSPGEGLSTSSLPYKRDRLHLTQSSSKGLIFLPVCSTVPTIQSFFPIGSTGHPNHLSLQSMSPSISKCSLHVALCAMYGMSTCWAEIMCFTIVNFICLASIDICIWKYCKI